MTAQRASFLTRWINGMTKIDITQPGMNHNA
jgi:hypothetical protein